MRNIKIKVNDVGICYRFITFLLNFFSAHLQFGYCQAGTSGVILEDDTVVLGSPGSYNWRGNIFITSILDDFFERDKSWYHSPIRDFEKSPVDSYSYLGNFRNTHLFDKIIYFPYKQ